MEYRIFTIAIFIIVLLGIQNIQALKPKILPIIYFFTIIFCLDWFLIEPFNEEKYFYWDISNFEDVSWKYSLITFFTIYLSLIIYLKITSKKAKIKRIKFIYFLLVSVAGAFFLHDFTKDLMLFFNTSIKKESIVKEYNILRHDPKEVLYLYSHDKEVILFKNELNRIDVLRKRKHLSSIYDLKDQDTIMVNYNKGFLGIKYLEL